MQHHEVHTVYGDKRLRTAVCTRMGLRDSVDFGEFYVHAIDDAKARGNTGAESRLRAEVMWYMCGKPYYLVYPCILEMLGGLKLTTPILPVRLLDITPTHGKDSSIRTRAVALRLPVGKPTDLHTALLTFQDWDSMPEVQMMTVHTMYGPGGDAATECKDSLCIISTDGKVTLGGLMEDCKQAPLVVGGALADVMTGERGVEYADVPDYDDNRDRELRLLACFGLLVESGADLLERDLLAKDRGKPVTQAAIDRAARLKGQGWSIGRTLESIPHTRRPHWGIRCTGAGGAVRKLVPIKGSIVHRKAVEKMPTGYDTTGN